MGNSLNPQIKISFVLAIFKRYFGKHLPDGLLSESGKSPTFTDFFRLRFYHQVIIQTHRVIRLLKIQDCLKTYPLTYFISWHKLQ